MEGITLGTFEIIVLDLAAIFTIITFFWMREKARQAKLELTVQRFTDKIEATELRHEDKLGAVHQQINDHKKYTAEQYQQLSAACMRREEITPIHHALTEIRHRIDDLYAIHKNKK